MIHYTDRQRAENRALHCLVKAAAELLVPTSEGKAAALLYAAEAIVHIAESDPEQRAHDLAIKATRLALERA